MVIKSKTPKPLNLYWVETEDHGEDWFVVARTAGSACRMHEDDEGYARGDADAEIVCALPSSLTDVEPGWPSDEALKACGAEWLPGNGGDGNPRCVRIQGRVFGEGDVFVLAAARAGQVTRH